MLLLYATGVILFTWGEFIGLELGTTENELCLHYILSGK